MKRFFQKVKDKVALTAYQTQMVMANPKAALSNTKGEGYVDSGVKILIAVVIGALLLAGLYTLFNGTIMPTVTNKIKNLFNYRG